MNAKERVRIAMSGGTPDRVPVVPQICPPHAIRVAGLPFKETIVDRLRNPRKYDLLEPECALGYGVDGVRVWIGASPRNIEWQGENAYEVDVETGERIGMVDFMGGGEVLRLPSQRRQLTDEDIEAIEVVPAEDLLESEALIPMKKVVAEYGDKLFIIGPPGGFNLETLSVTQGIEPTLIDIIERPDFIKRHSEKMLAVTIQRAIAMAKAGAEAFYIGQTFGQFMSPDQFKELFLPYFQQFVQTLRPYGPLIYLHMCGQVTHLLDLMVETGVDCVEPMDEVGGTSVAQTKQRIGDQVALMGGVNTVVLAHGTLEEVREDCIRCIGEAGADGGYILAAGDMLPTETDPEKVKVMLECAKEVGRYDCG